MNLDKHFVIFSQFVDWLEHDETTLTLWHGGVAPTQLRDYLQIVIGNFNIYNAIASLVV